MEKYALSQTILDGIEEQFLKNEGKSITGKFLKSLFVINTIQLQEGIRRLRLKGMPIVSRGTKGYAYVNDKEEIIKTALSLIGRGMKIIEVGNSMLEYQGEGEEDYDK